MDGIFDVHPEIKTIFERKLGKEEFNKLNERKFVDMDSKLAVNKTNTWQPLPSRKKFEEKKIEEPKMTTLATEIDAKNKFEFPGLKHNITGPGTLPLPPADKKKIGGGGTGTGWEKKQPYGYSETELKKNVELKKKVEEDFPDLTKQNKAGGKIIFLQKELIFTY